MGGLTGLNLVRNPGRTALTAAGIAIGLATIVALLALTQGLKQSVGGLSHLGVRAPVGASDRLDLPAEAERQSHYFFADLASQFDAVVHIDATPAVEPLERTAWWAQGELPETYPTAL